MRDRCSVVGAVGLISALLFFGCRPGAGGRSVGRGDDIERTSSETTGAGARTGTESESGAESGAESGPEERDETVRVGVAEGFACPPGKSRVGGYPPWEVRNRFDRCVSGPEGRWLVTQDSTDKEGWRYFLQFEGVGKKGWKMNVTAPVGLARRVDGNLVLLDLKRNVTLISPEGKRLWEGVYPKCGAVNTVAVGWDNSIVFSCGWSVVRLGPDGGLEWRVQPFGKHRVSNAWVDRGGIIYVSGNGRVAALNAKGKISWILSTGVNRMVGRIAWKKEGNLVFITSMAERLSKPTTSGERFHHERVPNELFEVTRKGKIVNRKEYEKAPPEGGWPEVLPTPEDGSHRVR